MEDKIKKAILETLVIDNPESIHFTLEKIINIINDQKIKAYKLGFASATDVLYSANKKVQLDTKLT
ncbi:MAG: hypothetical protein ABI241_00405 [Bacteroidia bacterium]